jgi:creatinine amidohydrolase
MTTRQIEFLRPHQIRATLAEKAVVWIPLGTIEWHCEHLPVGLDALTAHGLCLAAAAQAGGLVLPPLYYGTGGGHGAYPWTIMMPTDNEIAAQLTFTLRRLAELGVKRAVLMSGHFADEQLAMIDRLAAEWDVDGTGLSVVATSMNRCPDAGMPPDHAGVFETTLLSALHPETVDMTQLPNLETAPDTADRHDPDNPIWGVIGADPRLADLATADALKARMTDWLAAHA